MYSFNDISVGDIYEHYGGQYWMVISKNSRDETLTSYPVNGVEVRVHKFEDVRKIWFMDKS